MEQVRATTLADRTGLMASGAELDPDDLPDPEASVRRLDELLVAEPDGLDGLDPDTADLLVGLGLRR